MTTNVDNVISLPRTDGSAANCFARIAGYWQSLCGDAPVPFRSQIDPRAIAGHLDKVILIERIGPTISRIRLAGQHLTDLMGMETRGMPLSSLFAPADRDSLANATERLFSDPARLDLTVRTPRSILARPSVGQMMFLPLLDRDGHVTRAIGVFSCDGLRREARAPQRLEITNLAVRRLIGAPSHEAEKPAARSDANGRDPRQFLRVISNEQ